MGKMVCEQCGGVFQFDNQMLAKIIYAGFSIGFTCPTRYEEGSSSISFGASVEYGIGVLKTAVKFRLQGWGWHKSDIFEGLNRRNSWVVQVDME